MAELVKVFISHKQEDSAISIAIRDRLVMRHDLDVYLDVIDSKLGYDGLDLAQYIQARLAECTQLLAVMTQRTKVSWWVPWEIGVATEKRRFLASYVEDLSALPEYLRKWPFLRSLADVDKYAVESKRGSQQLTEALRTHTASFAADRTFRSFTTELRKSLGQT